MVTAPLSSSTTTTAPLHKTALNTPTFNEAPTSADCVSPLLSRLRDPVERPRRQAAPVLSFHNPFTNYINSNKPFTAKEWRAVLDLSPDYSPRTYVNSLLNYYNSQVRTDDTLCWNCERALGGGDMACSWHERGEPVKGWEAKEKSYDYGADGTYLSYQVMSCPEFQFELNRDHELPSIRALLAHTLGVCELSIVRNPQKWIDKWNEYFCLWPLGLYIEDEEVEA